MLKKTTTGLQHIGIQAWDLDNSVKFYEALGFERIHRKKTNHNEITVEATFVKIHDLVIELYVLKDQLIEEVNSRSDGHINHFAINVLDIEELFVSFKETDFEMIDDNIQRIDFFDHGVEFFRILGPNKEVIEFNQIMQNASETNQI